MLKVLKGKLVADARDMMAMNVENAEKSVENGGPTLEKVSKERPKLESKVDEL